MDIELENIEEEAIQFMYIQCFKVVIQFPYSRSILKLNQLNNMILQMISNLKSALIIILLIVLLLESLLLSYLEMLKLICLK